MRGHLGRLEIRWDLVGTINGAGSDSTYVKLSGFDVRVACFDSMCMMFVGFDLRVAHLDSMCMVFVGFDLVAHLDSSL